MNEPNNGGCLFFVSAAWIHFAEQITVHLLPSRLGVSERHLWNFRGVGIPPELSSAHLEAEDICLLSYEFYGAC